MRTVRLIAVFTLAVTVLAGPARCDIITYYNRMFLPGENLFGMPLRYPTNNLSSVIPTPPDGTTVSLWDPAVGGYTLTSVFAIPATCSCWSVDFVVPPGQGARLVTATLFTNTFVGTILNADGSVYTGTISPPPVFTGSNGVYLLACKAPISLSGTDTNVTYPVFNYILGRGPLAGESFTRLNPTNQTYQTTIWSGSAWSDGVPALNISEAGLFNIGPVPVPQFEITSIVREGNNIKLTWTTGGGTTNQVQVTGGSAGSFSTNGFTNLGAPLFIPGSGIVATNYTDTGGATNKPARYYRLRLVP